jgi:hypothetical protein
MPYLCCSLYHVTELRTMAKAQTFGDKSKKKAGDNKLSVKVIKAYRSEKGTTKFLERFVKVDDLGQLDKMEITR